MSTCRICGNNCRCIDNPSGKCICGGFCENCKKKTYTKKELERNSKSASASRFPSASNASSASSSSRNQTVVFVQKKNPDTEKRVYMYKEEPIFFAGNAILAPQAFPFTSIPGQPIFPPNFVFSQNSLPALSAYGNLVGTVPVSISGHPVQFSYNTRSIL